MRTKAIVIIILVFGPKLFAQISSIDAIGGVGQSFRVLSNENMRAFEEPKISWKAGLNLNIELGKTIELKTGLAHTQVSYYEMIIRDVRWPSEHDGNGGFLDDPSLPNDIKFSLNYRFIELPVDFRFEFLEGKWQPYLELGFSMMLYRATKATQTTEFGIVSNISKESNVSEISFFGNAAFGVNYQITNEFQLFMQGGYQEQLNQLKSLSIDERLFQYGVVFGFRKLMNLERSTSKEN